MPWTLLKDGLEDPSIRGRRHEVIAAVLEHAIVSEQFRRGERLPTVRQLSRDLGVSAATVAASYKRLQQQGLIRGGVGRGTFVTDKTAPNMALADQAPRTKQYSRHDQEKRFNQAPAAWRKRALNASSGYLRSAYPNAADCSTGRPDPQLLPVAIIRQSWNAVMETVEPSDLQYAGAEPIPSLVSAVAPHLASDSILVEAPDLIVASSAQQLMVLALDVVSSIVGDRSLMVAVEEPGYPTILDTYERAGCRLVGMNVDDFGVTPESLNAALEAGAKLVLLTPRAHNPTGASWTSARRAALAEVLSSHRTAFIVEDDQFAGIAVATPGSLLSDPRLEQRVLYLRSFSKAIAPDLRIAVGVARGRFRSMLVEAKGYADGWTSRLIQRVLAHLLTSKDLPQHLQMACDTYASRRHAATEIIDASLATLGGHVTPSMDGVNIWIHLPPGIEVFTTLRLAAALDVVAAPGEPFYIRPGRGDVIRMNAGAVDVDRARLAAEALVTAVTNSAAVPTMAMVV